jgi:hypothetical protein
LAFTVAFLFVWGAECAERRTGRDHGAGGRWRTYGRRVTTSWNVDDSSLTKVGQRAAVALLIYLVSIRKMRFRTHQLHAWVLAVAFIAHGAWGAYAVLVLKS